jgi:hypothetical protein
VPVIHGSAAVVTTTTRRPLHEVAAPSGTHSPTPARRAFVGSASAAARGPAERGERLNRALDCVPCWR